jgi:UDP-N-acetylmuramoyl-tripeptide--D-alanyl-D-alanine ligase
MPSFAPAYLATWTGGQWTSKPALPLAGFTQDTRQLRAGQVFVALRTDKRDGHDFLATAMAAGASAALVSRANPDLALPQLVVADPLRAFQTIAREHRRAFRGAVVGVTGSCGKTSTKNLLARLLGGEPLVLATEGNLNNHLGVPLTLTRLEPGGHESAVIEAGISGPGEMDVLAGMIEPDYGIVTLVAPAHTEELGGLSGVAREKAVLLQHIRPGGLSVIPKQCWDFHAFQDLPQQGIVLVPEGEFCGASRTVRFAVRASPTSTEIMLGGRRRFDFRRVSRGMAQNAALAILLASELGVTDDAIQRALEDWQPSKWRGEFRHDGQRLLYLDFYNANPASMIDALDSFASIVPADESRLYVLGCMEVLGVEAASYHRELGNRLRLRPQDRAFVIGGHAVDVVAGVADAGFSTENIEIVNTLAPVAAHIAEFRGAIFMKGSRRYELEKALPAESGDSHGSIHGGSSGGSFNASSGNANPDPGSAGPASGTRSAFTTISTATPFGWQYPRAATASRSPERPSAFRFL